MLAGGKVVPLHTHIDWRANAVCVACSDLLAEQRSLHGWVATLRKASGVEVDPSVVAAGKKIDGIDPGARQSRGESFRVEGSADCRDPFARMEIKVNLTKWL